MRLSQHMRTAMELDLAYQVQVAWVHSGPNRAKSITSWLMTLVASRRKEDFIHTQLKWIMKGIVDSCHCNLRLMKNRPGKGKGRRKQSQIGLWSSTFIPPMLEDPYPLIRVHLNRPSACAERRNGPEREMRKTTKFPVHLGWVQGIVNHSPLMQYTAYLYARQRLGLLLLS